MVDLSIADEEKDSVREYKRESTISVPLVEPSELLQTENVFQKGEAAEQYHLPKDEVGPDKACDVADGQIDGGSDGSGGMSGGAPPKNHNRRDSCGIHEVPNLAPDSGWITIHILRVSFLA